MSNYLAEYKEWTKTADFDITFDEDIARYIWNDERFLKFSDAERRKRYLLALGYDVGFNPASLFTSGSGFCYPLSDGTIWQDAAGTLPVTADGQVVGLAQDASKGLVLGQEYVTNAADREFTSDTGFWAKEGNSSISGGVVNINNAPGTAAIYKFNFPNTWGGYVEVSFDLVITAGAVRVLYGGAYSQTFTTSGRKTVRMYRSAVGTLAITSAGSVTALGTIDNISVREILGNHATQPGSASIRPTYKTNPTRLSFDGSDDRLVSTLMPTPSGTIACRFQTSTVSRAMIGSIGTGRCFLGTGSDGRLGAGIGSQNQNYITGGSNILGTGWHSGAVTWDGATVRLYLDGEQVYSGAQSGAVDTTIPMTIGALNANGTQTSFFGGDILANPVVLDYAATPAQIAKMHQAWSKQT